MLFDTNKLDKFPILPGVYLMKGRNGTVLYVGKANNLRQRVRQYYGAGGDGRFMVPFLISKVEEIETIIVTSEKEAFLLENNLIKKYQPRYNALLKDDKTYVALKINHRDKWPTVTLIRYKGKPKDDGLYFGPYLSAYAARQTLDFLHKVFPLRKCSDQEMARRVRPCVLYEMKRCLAPCVNKTTEEVYQVHLDRIIKFLRGQNKEVLQDLYDALQKASDDLEFEKAADIHQMILQIEKTVESQNVDKPLGSDSDVFGIFRQGDEIILSQMLFRSGKLLGTRHFNFSNNAQEDHELLESFLIQHYDQQMDMPHDILLPVQVEGAEAIEDILSANRKRKVHLIIPQRGDKVSLIEMAQANAKSAFEQQKDVKLIREKTLLDMQEKLKLNRYPRRIECFDNSHIQGNEPVASMVAFTDGAKDSSRYRKYKIRSAESSDDYGAMYEVLTRRYKRAKEENDLPDLVIVDGGKGQLNMALKVFKELDIISVDVIGLAKEQGRHDKGMTTEQIFIPDIKDPIIFKKTSPVLFLMQQIRDEAHRVALTFHRKRRNKQIVRSALDDVPGIGPARRRAILKHFGSLKKLKEATREEIQEVKGLTSANVQSLWDFIHKGHSQP